MCKNDKKIFMKIKNKNQLSAGKNIIKYEKKIFTNKH